MKQITITTRQLVLSILAIFVMFLPRNLSIAGMFSFRFFIIGAGLLAFLIFHIGVRLSGLVRMPTFWLYIGAIVFVMFTHGQYTVLLGTLVDILVLYLVMNSCMRSKNDMNFFVRVFLVVLIVYSAMCLLETMTGLNLWSILGVNVESYSRFGLHRAYGAYTTSINNGSFLLLTFPLIWYAQKFFHSKLLPNVAMISSFIALFCTMSRGPILFALILNIVIVWRSGIFCFIKRHFLAVFMAILLFTAVIVFLPSARMVLNNFFKMFQSIFDSSVAEDISQDFGSNANGVGHRFMLYSWVWEESAGHRLFGVGANVPLNHLWKPDSYHIALKQSIENFYLATFFQYGFTGLISLIAFLLETLTHVFMGYKRERKSFALIKAGSSFQFRIFITFICYFGTLFTVSAVDDFKMFIILLVFSEAYHRIYVKTPVVVAQRRLYFAAAN